MATSYQKLASDLKAALIADTALNGAFLYDVDLFATAKNNYSPNAQYYAKITVPSGPFITFDNEIMGGSSAFDDATDADTEHWKYDITLFANREGFPDSEEIYDATGNTVFRFLDLMLNGIAKSWKFDDRVMSFSLSDVQNRDDLGQAGFVFSFSVTYDVVIDQEGR